MKRRKLCAAWALLVVLPSSAFGDMPTPWPMVLALNPVAFLIQAPVAGCIAALGLLALRRLARESERMERTEEAVGADEELP